MHTTYYMFHNKTVKTSRVDMLSALLPYYPKVEELPPFPTSKRILFTGKNLPNLRKRLEDNYESYVMLSQAGEIDLSNTVSLVKFVYSRFDKEPPQKVLDLCESMSQEEVESMMKQTWVTGKFPIKIVATDLSIYDLYKTIPGPQREMIKTLLQITDQLPINVVESSILTLLARVKDLGDQEVSVHYKKLLNQISTKVGDRIPKVIRKYSKDMDMNREIALMTMLLNLRGR